MRTKLCIALLFFVSTLSFGIEQELSHPPGNYAESISLELPAGYRYYFEESADHTPVRYALPIHLSALEGESRKYTLNVIQPEESGGDRHRYTYTIDRKPPVPPEASVEQGVYFDEIALTFQYSPGETIYYSVRTEDFTEYRKWAGEPVLLEGNEGYIVTYILEVYAVDEVGNRSSSKTYTYVVNKLTNDPNHYLDVISPVPGQFRNKQLLACNQSGLTWIRYTLNGENPVTEGVDYQKPVLIDRRGKITLRIAGYAEHSKDIIEKRVEFSVEGNAESILSLESGVVSETQSIEYTGEKAYTISFNDTTPDRYDDSVFSPIVLEPRKNLRYPVIIRFADPADPDIEEYRYTYILDGWVPAPPKILAFPGGERSGYNVALLGERGARIMYTLDGTSPGENAEKYTGVFRIDAPSTESESSVTIRAVSISNTGAVSREAEETINFFFRQLPAPRLQVTDQSIIRIESEVEGTIVYETGGNPLELAVPDMNSSALAGDINLAVPYGMEKELFFQAAVFDEYGNISNPSKIVRIQVDNHPPPEPTLRFLDGLLKISSQEGTKTYYSLSRSGSAGETTREKDLLYDKPFFLYGEDGEKIDYTVEAYAVDSAGNTSGKTGLLRFSIDRRTPQEPVVTGVEDGAVYNKPLTIRFTSPYADQRILYEIAALDGDAHEELTVEKTSPAAERGIVSVPGSEGEVDRFLLVYAPYLRSNDSLGEQKSITFSIDQSVPEVPVISGPESGSLHTGSVSFRLENPAADAAAYYSVGFGGEAPPDCFGEGGRKFTTSVQFEGENGKEIIYTLMFGVIDAAGNKSYGSEIITVIIDRKPPEAPKPEIVETDDSDKAGQLQFSGESDRVYYEISRGDRMPEIPGMESALYDPENPIIFEGGEGTETVFHIRAKSVDRAGNSSEISPVYSFHIDRKKPETLNGPVYVSLDNETLEISWEHIRNLDVYYAFDGGEWEPYTEPISVSTRSVRSISYYYEDASGNASSPVSSTLPVYKKSADVNSFLTGAEPGSRYRDAVDLVPNPGEYICRYESAYREKYLQEITQFSPIMEDKIRFDVLTGETREFFINAQLFDPETNLPVSEAKNVHFTIDKTKPQVPQINMEEITYFQDAVSIPIQHEEGSLFYSITRYDAYGNEIERIEEKKYEGPLDLDIPKGEYSRFTVSAFTVDEVGNKSQVVSVSDIVIDKKIIYVSRIGNDLYEGSRMNPFRTIEKAVEYAKVTGRNILYISGGRFEINDTLELDEDMLLYGGYDPFTWKQDDPTGTVISSGEFIEKGQSLVEVSSGNIYLQGLTVVTAQSDPLPVEVRSGELTAEAVTIMNLEKDSSPLIRQFGGRIELRNCSLQSFSMGAEECILSSKGELSIKNTSIQNKGDHGGTISLLRSIDAGVYIDNSVFIGGRAVESRLITATNSHVECTESVFSTGIENGRAFGIFASGSEIVFEKSALSTDKSTRINTAVSAADNSNLTIRNSEIYFTGGTGGIGIKASQSTVSVDDTILRGDGGAEFLYPVQLNGGKAGFQNNFITVTAGGDFIGFNINGGENKVFNNTVIFTESTPNSLAVWCRNSRLLYLVNNIFIDKSRLSEAAAFSLDETGEREIIANNLYGWKTFLSEDGKIYTGMEGMNGADGNRRGGAVHKNISESFSNAFLISKTEAPYYLKQTSLCVNGGIDITEMGGKPMDFEGDPRPNPDEGLKPEYDIGADEY